MRYLHLITALLVFFSTLINCQEAAATQPIEAWTYYPSPPFQTHLAGNEGLTADLLAYLNQELGGVYQIRLVNLPRARLNMLLERGAKAFVVFAPSAIFGGPDGGKYLWSEALFQDRQELVSRKDQPFEFNGPASLIGVNFAAMLGHVYPMLAKEMESGQIKADRNTNESSLFSMLMARHVQVITVPNSTVRYFMSVDPMLKQSLHISKNNLGEFSRHLMFQRGMEKQRADFNQVVLKMGSDPKWIAILKKYGLEPVSPKKNN